MSIDNLARILQASIAPCVLISGLGLLLLSIANRLARPIDRIRLLCHEIDKASNQQALSLKEQISILYKRCRLLQISIAFNIISIAFVSIIILALFFTYIFNIHLMALIEASFVISLTCMILSLLYFLLDISAALRSVKIEMDQYIK